MEYFKHGLILGILYVVCDPCDWCSIDGIITGCWGMFTRGISAINWVHCIIYNGKNVLIEHNDYYPCTIQCKSDRGILCPEILEGNATFIYPTALSPIPTSAPTLQPSVASSISPSTTPSFSPVLPPPSEPTIPPAVSPTRPTYETVFQPLIYYVIFDSSDVEFESLEFFNNLGADIDIDGRGDNDTYYFNPEFRIESNSKIKIDLNTQQKVHLFEHDLNDVNINIACLIDNESNTAQALIADGYAIIYIDKNLLIADPDDFSYGNCTIESYLVIYSSQSIKEYSRSICRAVVFINNSNHFELFMNYSNNS